MDRIRQLIAYINQQLGGLSASQRLAIGLCAALIAVSLLWLMQWSTTPELVPLLKKDFTYAELDGAEEALRSNGLTFETRGTRIYVRSEDRHNALRLMYSAGALPEGSLFDMDAVVADQNPFMAPEAREFAQNYARGNELAKIIASSPFVTTCSVMINPKTKRRLGGHTDVPTASVTVTLARGVEMSADMVESFAKLVAGAVAGLKPQNVSIVDASTLRSYSVPGADDSVTFSYMRIIKQRENYLRDKILGKLADIPGVQVAVTVELDTSKRVTQKIQRDAPQTKSEKSKSSENSSSRQPAGPGTVANLGQAITANGAGSTDTNEESLVENYEPQVSQTETIEQMPFARKRVGAAIGIPRSFIAGIFKARFPDRKPPADDDKDFMAIRDKQVARVKTSVERIVMADHPDDVQVDVYPDMDWTASGGAWNRTPAGVVLAGGGEELDAVGLLKTYGPEAGLVILALMSLLMMTRIAKSAAPPPPPMPKPAHASTEYTPSEEPLLTVGPYTVGQVEAAGSNLTGQEVDGEALRFQELGEEVSSLIKEDPEGAAQLIRRWMDGK